MDYHQGLSADYFGQNSGSWWVSDRGTQLKTTAVSDLRSLSSKIVSDNRSASCPAEAAHLTDRLYFEILQICDSADLELPNLKQVARVDEQSLRLDHDISAGLEILQMASLG